MFVGAAVSIGTAAYGAYSSNKASKNQKNAMNAELQLGRENLAWQKEQYASDQARYDEQWDYQTGNQQDAIAQSREQYDQGLGFAQDVYGSSQDLAEQERAESQRQLNNWEGMFGSMQQNLSDYYQTMDPRDFAARSKGTIDEAYTRSNEALQSSLAQRGIQGGGVEAGSLAQLQSATALARGQAVTQSELAYGQAQQGFLNSGAQQSQAQTNMLNSLNPASATVGAAGVSNAFGNNAVSNAMLGSPSMGMASSAGVGNAYNTVGNTYGNQATTYGNQAAMGGKALASGIGSFMDIMGTSKLSWTS